MLEVRATKSLGDFAIDAVFTAPAGVTALFGQSGSGKSSIVAMVAGLVAPDEGHIVLNGRTLFRSDRAIDLPPRDRRVGVVFQDALLFPHMSVRRNLLYGQWAGGRQPNQSLTEIAELLGIGELLERRPAKLSGGEAQRVAIGRALLADPEILLMDEPLAHLDGPRKSEILPWLDRLAHDGGVPILYVSHLLDEVMRLANNVVIVAGGTTPATGPIAEILNRRDFAPIVGRHEAGTLLEAEVVGLISEYQLARLQVGNGELLTSAGDLQVGDRVRIRVRANDVALALDKPAGMSIRNVIPGSVIEIRDEDATQVDVLIDIGGKSILARITRHAMDDLQIARGLRVHCLVKSVAIQRP